MTPNLVSERARAEVDQESTALRRVGRGPRRSVPIDQRRARIEDWVEKLTEAGATTCGVMDSPEQGHFAVGMVDPEGNEFDVV